MRDEPAGDSLRDKARLRERILGARRALEPDRRAELSAAVAGRLYAFAPWRAARTIHAYIGAVDGEVATRPIVECALAAGKHVACPVVGWRPRRLESRRIGSLGELVETPRGLWEPPSQAPAVDPAEVDLVLVPGIAFDALGNRLGYGAGFYDRLLAGLSAVKVALAFNLQVVNRVPATPNDVPVDWVLTESETIACQAARQAAQRDAMP